MLRKFRSFDCTLMLLLPLITNKLSNLSTNLCYNINTGPLLGEGKIT